MFSDMSPGCPIWLHNGNIVYSLLQEKIRALNAANGYQEVRTPMMWKPELYQTSGHWEHFRDNMFVFRTWEEGKPGWSPLASVPESALKPMNCPGHMLIYKATRRSYRDLPLRIADQTVLHRNETSGAIGGLFRCRAFSQDDGHCFVKPEDVQAEIASIIVMVQKVYQAFGMPIRCVLSTRPESHMGSEEAWDSAEVALQLALEKSQLSYQIAKGDGAFYGPKIDCIVKDAMDREWQTATIQLDFQLPEKFGLTYQDSSDMPKEPVVIHRAIYGSFERFIGILLEHYDGALPFWIAPIQLAILPIAERHAEYARGFLGSGVRSILDDSNNTLNHKIAVAQAQKIPFIVVIGDREVSARTVAVRDGKNTSIDGWDFMRQLIDKNRFDY